MALPAGVNLATVTTGVFATLESGLNLAVTITAQASETDLVWSTDGITGAPYLSQPFSNHANVGEEVSLQLLPTDLANWWYNGAQVNVSGGNQAFVWSISAQAFTEDAQGRDQPLGSPIVWSNVVLLNNNGNPGTFDLDMMASNTFEGNTLVTIPFPAWAQGILNEANAAADAANTANTDAQAANTAAQEASDAAQAAADAANTANTDAQAANAAAWNAANSVGTNLDPILANVLLAANSASYAAVFGQNTVTFTYYANGLVNTVTESNSDGEVRKTQLFYYTNGAVNNTVETTDSENVATTTFGYDANGNVTTTTRTVS